MADDGPRDEQDEQRWESQGPPPPSSAEMLMTAMFEAGPEAADHLLNAARELLLAAKAVVDAGERVVDAHRADRQSTETDGEAPAADRPGVRRIDLA